MTGAMTMMKGALMVQLFYAFAITLIVGLLPAEAVVYAQPFQDIGDDISLKDVSEDVQGSVDDQVSIPLVELGALVFYSGNILIDLILNFFTAIPQMVVLLIQGVTFFLPIPADAMAAFQLFLTVVVGVFYFINVLELLANIRTGRSIS